MNAQAGAFVPNQGSFLAAPPPSPPGGGNMAATAAGDHMYYPNNDDDDGDVDGEVDDGSDYMVSA